VVCLLFGAPVFAELIQSYLDITGELGGTLIHLDEEGPDAETSVAKYALSLECAVALALAAFTPLGRPVTSFEGRGTRSPAVLGIAGSS